LYLLTLKLPSLKSRVKSYFSPRKADLPSNWTRNKKLEIIFLATFSVAIVTLFYTLISMNGIVLGNDPVVHLSKAQIFLQTGQIPLSNIGWIPPLFEIMLATVIALTGASSFGQLIFLVKVLAVIVDWLLFISVYLVSSRFFNKKVGAVSAVFLALCFPIYELNTWGGYTTVLGMAFLVLLLYYAHLATKQSSYVVVTFFVTFSLILAHQLTAFLAVVIMLPVMFFLLIKSKGAFLKGFMAILLGGSIAFFAFYYPAIISHLDTVIYHVFFSNQAYTVQIPYTNAESFFLYYGFIQFFAVGGIAVSYRAFKKQKKQILFATLLLSLLVPLFFAESYLFGFLLPFEWFTYYLTPPIAILGAVFAVLATEKLSVYFAKNRQNTRKKTTAIVLMMLLGGLIVFPVYNTYGRVVWAGEYNSTANPEAYDAAVWLSQNYFDTGKVVVTQSPGDWFTFFSGKAVISQTYDWEGANDVADSVIGLDYEMYGSQSLIKAFEVKNSFDEFYVSLDQLWRRVAFSSTAQDYISFDQNNVNYCYLLANLSRTVSFDNPANPQKLEVNYFNNQVALKRTMFIQNGSYAINNSWSITPLNNDISNVTLHLTTYFDLQFHFDTAQIPQLMDWENPWDMPKKITNGEQWAIVDFLKTDITEHYIGLYDKQNQLAFAFYFTDLPDSGNIGALDSYQIDALRYQYDFSQIGANQTVMRQFQVLTLSQSGYPTLEQNILQSLFSVHADQTISTHCYKDFITENNIAFIVYDKNQIDRRDSLPLSASFLPQVSQCKFIELVYSNSRYDIFKIDGNYNQTQIWK
jgi:hypothetical protein